MQKLLSTALALALSAAHLAVAATAAIDNENDRISYSVGNQVARDLKANGVAINKDALLRAIEDAMSGAQPAMSDEEMRATLVEFKRKIMFAQKKQTQKNAEKLLQADRAFLAQNGQQPGVVTTASGLQYQLVLQGQGKSPKASDEVTVHYRGTTIDNKEFDSSARKGKPVSFKLSQVIPGWSEGLQLLKEGGKIKLFIPPALAYGERGPLADRALIFDVELLAVKELEADKK